MRLEAALPGGLPALPAVRVSRALGSAPLRGAGDSSLVAPKEESPEEMRFQFVLRDEHRLIRRAAGLFGPARKLRLTPCQSLQGRSS